MGWLKLQEGFPNGYDIWSGIHLVGRRGSSIKIIQVTPESLAGEQVLRVDY